ncbi:hypothetical protein WDU94_002626 [Cyamophila willieti]
MIPAVGEQRLKMIPAVGEQRFKMIPAVGEQRLKMIPAVGEQRFKMIPAVGHRPTGSRYYELGAADHGTLPPVSEPLERQPVAPILRDPPGGVERGGAPGTPGSGGAGGPTPGGPPTPAGGPGAGGLPHNLVTPEHAGRSIQSPPS